MTTSEKYKGRCEKGQEDRNCFLLLSFQVQLNLIVFSIVLQQIQLGAMSTLEKYKGRREKGQEDRDCFLLLSPCVLHRGGLRSFAIERYFPSEAWAR